MNEHAEVWTDTATIAVFDPTECRRRELSCGRYPHYTSEVVRNGVAAVLDVSSDGIYKVRITDESLTAEEQALVHDEIHVLGLEVTSGRIYISGMDLPGDAEELLNEHGAGRFLNCPNGAFQLRIVSLRWTDGSPRGADIVVCLTQRVTPFSPVIERPVLRDVTPADIARIINDVETR